MVTGTNSLFSTLSAVLSVPVTIIPSVVVLPFSGGHQSSGKLEEDLTKASAKGTPTVSSADSDTALTVAVFRSATRVIEKVPLEDYLVGVVAAEMPAEFKEEALK